jgi:hypothetical protein
MMGTSVSVCFSILPGLLKIWSKFNYLVLYPVMLFSSLYICNNNALFSLLLYSTTPTLLSTILLSMSANCHLFLFFVLPMMKLSNPYITWIMSWWSTLVEELGIITSLPYYISSLSLLWCLDAPSVWSNDDRHASEALFLTFSFLYSPPFSLLISPLFSLLLLQVLLLLVVVVVLLLLLPLVLLLLLLILLYFLHLLEQGTKYREHQRVHPDAREWWAAIPWRARTRWLAYSGAIR